MPTPMVSGEFDSHPQPTAEYVKDYEDHKKEMSRIQSELRKPTAEAKRESPLHKKCEVCGGFHKCFCAVSQPTTEAKCDCADKTFTSNPPKPAFCNICRPQPTAEEAGKVCRCEEKNLDQSMCKGFPACLPAQDAGRPKCDREAGECAHCGNLGPANKMFQCDNACGCHPPKTEEIEGLNLNDLMWAEIALRSGHDNVKDITERYIQAALSRGRKEVADKVERQAIALCSAESSVRHALQNTKEPFCDHHQLIDAARNAEKI